MNNELLKLAKDLNRLGHLKHSSVVRGLVKTAGTITDKFNQSATTLAAGTAPDDSHQGSVLKVQNLLAGNVVDTGAKPASAGGAEDGQWGDDTEANWNKWVEGQTFGSSDDAAVKAALQSPSAAHAVVNSPASALAIMQKPAETLKTVESLKGYFASALPDVVISTKGKYYFGKVELQGRSWYVADGKTPGAINTTEAATAAVTGGLPEGQKWSESDGNTLVFFGGGEGSIPEDAITQYTTPTGVGNEIDLSRVQLMWWGKSDRPVEVVGSDIKAFITATDKAQYAQSISGAQGEAARVQADEDRLKDPEARADWSVEYVKQAIQYLLERGATITVDPDGPEREGGLGRGTPQEMFSAREARKHIKKVTDRNDWTGNPDGVATAVARALADEPRFTYQRDARWDGPEGGQPPSNPRIDSRSGNLGLIFQATMSRFRRGWLQPGDAGMEDSYGNKQMRKRYEKARRNQNKQKKSSLNSKLDLLHKTATKRINAEKAAEKRRARVRYENK